MIVLGDRACGSVTPGLYAVGLTSAGGTLKKFTAIAAPFDATIANPRKAQAVSMSKTLDEAWGLHAPTGDDKPYKTLPAVGIADLWGRTYYKTTWDAIEETKRMGVCRRIANLPKDLKTPYPVLMLHMSAFVEFDKDPADVEYWLSENLAGTDDMNPPWAACVSPWGEAGNDHGVFDWTWKDADALGRSGCDSYMWHSHVTLWSLFPQLKAKRLFSKFLRECEITLSQGVFGLTWITHHVQVLRPGQAEVDPALKAQGVGVAVSEHDPRAESNASGL